MQEKEGKEKGTRITKDEGIKSANLKEREEILLTFNKVAYSGDLGYC